MNMFSPSNPENPWHGSCFYKNQLCDSIVSYLQSFLSLIRLHASAAFLNFPVCLFSICLALLPGSESLAFSDPQAIQKSRHSIPVLCYHQVLPKATGMFEVSCENFKTQMALIKSSGFQPINGSQLMDILTGVTPVSGNPIVISFDDGYKSVYEYALPIMKEFGFPGIACVYPQFINGGGGMSWDQIRELVKNNWTIECHSSSHPDLCKAPANEPAKSAFFQAEIADPKRTIEAKADTKVRFMVWPYGIYTEETERFARQCGYVGAFTVDGGANYPGLDSFRVKRQVVYRTDSPDKFMIRLEMGSLEIADPSPRPGEVVHKLLNVQCRIPWMAGENPDNYVINAKITGGSLNFEFDPKTLILSAKPAGNVKPGSHFIDIYLRDKRTGVTRQNGWFLTTQ